MQFFFSLNSVSLDGINLLSALIMPSSPRRDEYISKIVLFMVRTDNQVSIKIFYLGAPLENFSRKLGHF